jgi:hypothetical protein
MHHLEAERYIGGTRRCPISPGFENNRLVSQISRSPSNEPGIPVRRAKGWHDAGPVDPLRVRIDLADPDPRTAFVQTDEQRTRVRETRIVVTPDVGEARTLDLVHSSHRRQGELHWSGRPRRLEARVRATTLEAESGIDDVGVHPKLVCAEATRARSDPRPDDGAG